ncbi:MAG TPA: hypothetical protein VIJ60_07720, partial [Acidimicrobiales bacterium]
MLSRLLRRGRAPVHPDELRFVCNVCGATSTVRRTDLGREHNSCSVCTSIVRWRSVVAAVSVSLFGRSLLLDQFPVDHGVVGLGMSDWDGYASRLARVF